MLHRALKTRFGLVMFTMLACVLFSPRALAQSITFQGRIANSAGTPVNGSATRFRVQILAPNATRCVLYDETQTLDLSNSAGLFSLNLNSLASTRNAPTSYTLEEAISNRTGFTVDSQYCTGATGTATYSPSPTDNRKVIISFLDPSTMGTSWETIPEMDLNPIPYAIESRTIGGFAAGSLLRVLDAGVPGTAPTLTTAHLTELQSLISGTSNNYMSSTAGTTTGARLPTVSGNPSAPAAGSIWFDTTGSGALKYYDSTGAVQTVGTGTGGGSITGVTAGTGLSGGGTSGAVTLNLGNTSVVPGSYGGAGAVPVITVDPQGRITSASTTAVAGTLPSGTSGQFLRSDGTAWTSQQIKLADIKNAAGSGPLFTGAGCTSAEALYWDSGTDEIKCQAIGGLNASVLTGGTITDARLANVATAGTFRSVTVDTKGRVTAGTNPTTLAGYGITDSLVGNSGGVPTLRADVYANIGPAGTAGRLFVSTDSLTLYRDNGTAWEIIGASGAGSSLSGVTGGAGLTGGGTSGNVTISMPNVGTPGTYFKVTTDAQGRISSGAGTLLAADIPNLDWAQIATGKPTTLAGYGITDSLVQNAGGALSLRAGDTASRGAFGTTGRIYIDTQASAVYYDTGTAWQTVATSTSATSVAVTAPITNSGSGTAPVIGIPAASASADGYLSSASFTAFTNKLSSALNSAMIFVGNGSNVATGVAVTGDVTLSNTGSTTVNAIKNQTISAQGAAAGQVLRYAGSNTWAPNYVSMADLRSTITGSSAITGNCTASQTLTWNSGMDNLQCQDISIAAATQITGVLPVARGGTGAATTSQGFVFAGPASGGTGAPSFRALSASDLPVEAKLWTESSGNIYRASGNVGIGTITPSDPLHVIGRARADILSVTSIANFLSDGSGNLAIRPTSNILKIQSGGGTNDFLTVNAGNVGIGTTTPGHLLDVATSVAGTAATIRSVNNDTSNAASHARLMAQTYAGGGSPIFALGAQGITNWYMAADRADGGKLKIGATGLSPAPGVNDLVTISTTGNLGIGTTNPGYPLDVNGYARIRGASSQLIVTDNTSIAMQGNSATAGSIEAFDPANASSKRALTLNAWGGNVGIGTTTPTAALHVKAGTPSTAPLKFNTGTLLTTPENGAMEYDGANYYLTVGTTRMAIPLAGGTASYSTVSSGAGTAAAPSLTFSSDNDTGFFSSGTNSIGITAAGSKIFDFSSAGLVSPTTGGPTVSTANGSAATPTYGFAGDPGTGWFRAAASTLAASTGGTERMRITSAGYVGIGTPAPGAPLHIRSTDLGQTSGDATSFATLHTASSTGNNSYLNFRAERTATNGTSSWANHIFKLQAKTDSVDFAWMGLGALSTTGSAYTAFGRGASELMRLDGNGYLGIGTAAPGSILDINGATSTTPTITGRHATSASTSQIDLYEATTGNMNLRTNYSLGSINFMTNGANKRMTIDPSGNVGIGTATPGSKLDVQGGAVNASGGYTQTSDIRLKTNLEPLHDSLAKLLFLRGIRYDWKDQARFGADKQIGLVAQDVEKAFPEAVRKNSEGLLSVSYPNLIAPVIEAIRELTYRMISTEAGLAQLRAENARLKAENDAIKAQNSAQGRELATLKAKEADSRAESAAVKAWICKQDPRAALCP